MAISADDFKSGIDAFHRDLDDKAKGVGPSYVGDGKFKPTVWHNQKFASRIEPLGTVNCPQALSVGRTLNALDVMLIASATNESPVLFPAGSTITMTFLQSDEEEGVYEEVGPTICVMAPASGKSAEAGEIIARFPMEDFSKPWLMVTLEFSGSISGGLCDCILSYTPR